AAGSYAFCTLGDACRYLTSDGSSFACNSCGDCTGGNFAVSSWCASGKHGNNNATNGGTTTGVGGTTTGGNSSMGGGTTTGRGGTTTGTGGTTTGTGGTTGGSACPTCLNTASGSGGLCESEVNACAADSKCANLISCIRACAQSDTTCQGACSNAAG